MASKTFSDIYTEYNNAVDATKDLESALATLIGKTDWETTVMSSKSKSVIVLYAELKVQRNTRETLESAVYTTP